jgi:hypothetical protein
VLPWFGVWWLAVRGLGWLLFLRSEIAGAVSAAVRAGMAAGAFPAGRATVPPAGRCCYGLGGADRLT